MTTTSTTSTADEGALREMPFPARVVVPLGRDAAAALPAGTRVSRGEPVVKTSAGAMAIAPCAGTVGAGMTVRVLNGPPVPAVEVVPIDVGTDAPPATPAADLLPVEALRRAGVQADRIASPDLLGQLTAAVRGGVDTVVCCTLDTDPAVRLNAAVAEAETEALVTGVRWLGRVVDVRPGRTWIVVDRDRPSTCAGDVRGGSNETAIKVIPLGADYPQADPTLLLYTLLNRRLPPGRLPTEQRVLLVDAAAAVTVGRFALHGEPMVRVPLGVRDHFEQRTHFVSVPIGTSITDVCAFLGIEPAMATLRAGEFLRDLWTPPDAVVAGGELVVHVTARDLAANPDPCIRCGWCVEACPTRIHPAGLLEAAQRDDAALARRYGVNACIECGICSYVCPTRLPLLASIRGLRQRPGK